MAKSRDKVQQQGFWDQEVTTAGHDDVMVWVDDNADLVMSRAFPELYGRGWIPDDIEWGIEAAARAAAMEQVEAFMRATPREDPRVKGSVWESPLRDDRHRPSHYQRSVCFADLIISATYPRIYVQEQDIAEHRRAGPLAIGVSWPRIGGHFGVLIEAKSVLPSRGDLIRQLRHYGTVFHGPMVVVSQDDSYAALLHKQGFRFVQCPRPLP
ncbi:hypothetical protein [Rhodanobacter denitrificans]|uniref:hypothetical protein n=1 Tax=Rhodanobacter denitrificans TaxID=666685 RepID=UPI001F33E2F2|nr:hypothetical protein [Rhodanobacter denitrificans]UJJ60620.1 hypothetical protein LRK55_19490 [Rhodanobacter denitrificans]